MKVLAFAGSLRKNSFNKSLLNEAVKLTPKELEVEVFDLAPIPLYSKDIELVGFPEPVANLREKIREADGVLIATPEYNYSISGVLKNTLDWISRPPEQPFSEKPIGIMGASDGGFGTIRAQMHLRQIFVTLNSFVMNRPQVHIRDADKKFDEKGNLLDEEDKEKIKKFMESFASWIKKFNFKRMLDDFALEHKDVLQELAKR